MTEAQTTLIENVRFWGVAKGLTGEHGKATIEAQYRKFYEEAMELFTALKENNVKEIRDALGDMQVVAILAKDIIGQETTWDSFDLKEARRTASSGDTIEAIHATATWELLQNPDEALFLVRVIALKLGHNPDECLQEAYDVISKRTGRMIDGQFVKDIAPVEDDMDEPLGQPQCQIGEECESCQ